jgi:hypothetical protein
LKYISYGTKGNRKKSISTRRIERICNTYHDSVRKSPFWSAPGWMYHVQVPPPLHKFDPSIPGISWVDLVFPFLSFLHGAAFPFALTRRREGGIQNSTYRIHVSTRIAPGILCCCYTAYPSAYYRSLFTISANLLALLTLVFFSDLLPISKIN